MTCGDCGMELRDGFDVCEECDENRLLNMTEADLRVELQRRGVDVDAFLRRAHGIIDRYKTPFNAAQFDADVAEDDE